MSYFKLNSNSNKNYEKLNKFELYVLFLTQFQLEFKKNSKKVAIWIIL